MRMNVQSDCRCDVWGKEKKTLDVYFIDRTMLVHCPISNLLCTMWVCGVPACVCANVCRWVRVVCLCVCRFSYLWLWQCGCVSCVLRSFIRSYQVAIINYCRDGFWIEIDQRDKSHGLASTHASHQWERTKNKKIKIKELLDVNINVTKNTHWISNNTKCVSK